MMFHGIYIFSVKQCLSRTPISDHNNIFTLYYSAPTSYIYVFRKNSSLYDDEMIFISNLNIGVHVSQLHGYHMTVCLFFIYSQHILNELKNFFTLKLLFYFFDSLRLWLREYSTGIIRHHKPTLCFHLNDTNTFLWKSFVPLSRKLYTHCWVLLYWLSLDS